MNTTEPVFHARPDGSVGQPWRVHVIWPKGKVDIVTGFETQHQALSWIRFHSANWVVEKIMKDPS